MKSVAGSEKRRQPGGQRRVDELLDTPFADIGELRNRDGRQVGQLRWAAFSPTLERMVAVALIDSDHADPGHTVTVRHHEGEADMETTTLPFIPRKAA